MQEHRTPSPDNLASCHKSSSLFTSFVVNQNETHPKLLQIQLELYCFDDKFKGQLVDVKKMAACQAYRSLSFPVITLANYTGYVHFK
jgi:hypothetical protein